RKEQKPPAASVTRRRPRGSGDSSLPAQERQFPSGSDPLPALDSARGVRFNGVTIHQTARRTALNQMPQPREPWTSERWIVLVAAFSAWMFAGMQISLFVLISRPAIIDILGSTVPSDEIERVAAQWFAWYQCAFLLGAAAGGWIFGALGDRAGRSKAM